MVMGGTCQKRQEFKIPFLCSVYESCPPSNLSLRIKPEEEVAVVIYRSNGWSLPRDAEFRYVLSLKCPRSLLLPGIPRTVLLSICV